MLHRDMKFINIFGRTLLPITWIIRLWAILSNQQRTEFIKTFISMWIEFFWRCDLGWVL